MSSGLKLPSQAGPFLFGALLSGAMSLLVSGVATLRAIGWTRDFYATWISAWLSAWPIAFAAVMVLAPLVRRLVAAIVAPSSAPIKPQEAKPSPGA